MNTENLITEYQALAYGIARKYRNKGVDWDDLKQESLIGLLKAAENYQPEKGTQFSTYASYWIKKQVINAVVTTGNKQNLPYKELAATPEPQNPNAQHELTLPSALPELEKSILILSFVQRLSLKEIARELNISVERVNQTRKKALRRLRLSPEFRPQHDA